jgi:hypothetical protein
MPRTNMRDLSFATFNLLNLQVPGGLTYGTTPPFPDTPEGRAAYRRKIYWIAVRLRELDAEVIGFQELWAAEALAEAFRTAGILEEYDLIARDAPGRGRPQVALAVRKGRHGQSQIAPGAAWQAEFPEGFALDRIREAEGAEEVVTDPVSSFRSPMTTVGDSASSSSAAMTSSSMARSAPASITRRMCEVAEETMSRHCRGTSPEARKLIRAGPLDFRCATNSATSGAPLPSGRMVARRIGRENASSVTVTTSSAPSASRMPSSAKPSGNLACQSAPGAIWLCPCRPLRTASATCGCPRPGASRATRS